MHLRNLRITRFVPPIEKRGVTKSAQTLTALNAHFSLSNDDAIVAELIAKLDLLN